MLLFYKRLLIIKSVTKTPRQETTATVVSPLPQRAKIIPAAKPTAAEGTLPVAYKAAGNVIAESTVEGVLCDGQRMQRRNLGARCAVLFHGRLKPVVYGIDERQVSGPAGT